MPKRFLLLPLLLILVSIALSACGGGGGGGGDTSASSGPTAEIEEALVESATSTDPSVCTEFDTPGFTEQAAHQEGSGAVKACEEEAPDSDSRAKSMAVANVRVEGSKATLEATADGGLFDGQKIEVAMVEEGGGWKVDEITKIVKLDSQSLEEAFEAGLEATGELTDAQVSCLAGNIGQAEQAQVEEVLLSRSAQPLIDLATGCV